MLRHTVRGTPLSSTSSATAYSVTHHLQIGHKHGSQAAPEIERAIIFYAKMFAKHSKLDWAQVQDLARDFDGLIREKWPRYYEELQGSSLSRPIQITNCDLCKGVSYRIADKGRNRGRVKA